MNKILLSIILFAVSFQLWACPGCAGSMDNPKSGYTVYILAGFIALTYIPFYLLYKTVFKYRGSSDHHLDDSVE